MCGIAGIYSLDRSLIENLGLKLNVMDRLLRHRGPDGNGFWMDEAGSVGFMHRRLAIIDLSPGGAQPMQDNAGNCIVYNGEIYNYIELRRELTGEEFKTASDTEVILAAYRKWGENCISRLRGMFAFVIWNPYDNSLFCARDRFGVKPFYYTVQQGVFYFASEIKALLPFCERIETDLDGFKDYLTFQFCLNGKTMFRGINELLPAHRLTVKDGQVRFTKYWDVYYEPDFSHTERYFEHKIRELLIDSVQFHLRGDVPVGSYLSGGVDSSAIASLAAEQQDSGAMIGFTGKFSSHGSDYDESAFARELAAQKGFPLYEQDITAFDFIEHIRATIYHLDYPSAGPGSFPQYMVSHMAAQKRKVVLGGQGGDEVFGGYARYLIAYFEQCIKGAIDGTMQNGNFVVTYESIIPNLASLMNYKPMLQEFWREGLFESMDQRYFRLINRAPTLTDEINWRALEPYSSRDTFLSIFNGNNVRKESYFDLMTHFDFKTLLPALLQVEDRMSMAHGLESRVPLLDHPLVELAATIPANIKFKNGRLKNIFMQAVRPYLPASIYGRKDKMGFPTPLASWIKGEAREFVNDVFTSKKALQRDFIDNRKVMAGLDGETRYGRKIWGLLSLEIWQQEFHDREVEFKTMLRHAYSDT